MTCLSVTLKSTSLVILTAACQPQAPSFNPDDPAILAAIDSAMTVAMAGSAAGNAEQALSITTRDSTFSFITGDVMLTGCFGLLLAVAEILQDLKPEILDTLTGLDDNTAPWDYQA